MGLAHTTKGVWLRAPDLLLSQPRTRAGQIGRDPACPRLSCLPSTTLRSMSMAGVPQVRPRSEADGPRSTRPVLPTSLMLMAGAEAATAGR